MHLVKSAILETSLSSVQTLLYRWLVFYPLIVLTATNPVYIGHLPITNVCYFPYSDLINHKPALVEFGDEARVGKLFRLVAPDVRPSHGDVFEADFHTGKVLAGYGNEPLRTGLVDLLTPGR